MSFRPVSSRCQLNWKVFNQNDDGSRTLVLPRYYADLFEASFPSIAKLASGGFRVSFSGKTRIATFPRLDEKNVKKIEAFLDWYGRVVCVSTNKHLEDNFSDELDFCLALDYNKPCPGNDRTELGELEFQAKYNQDANAINALAHQLAKAVRWLPPAKLARPRVLTYVPSNRGKTFYLPSELAQIVVNAVPSNFWSVENPLVTPTLTVAKQSAKNSTVVQKIAQWEQIAGAKGIRLSQSVRDYSVIVLDDLYQSGASLWSFAKFLKGKGASTVVGLACVKSLRDTDNR